ncbi:hypothetical protein LNL84_12775 [Vibrio sp. ZSDZ34]|jgi:hypothetical protein|uniref:Uncharacterized protein n=1 Tax=Vibrio gelatinilyticus TaxID=2893468 RepID=A0A9X1WB58_9VIBR|nr:hypothetical protein [Vibrio gelatinilyticus]MCJ2377702.1 hypothetical protein [Vibrio gelatinilyticus]
MQQCEINIYDMRDEKEVIILNIGFSDTTKADFMWSNMPTTTCREYISHLVVSGNVVAKKYITEDELSEMNRATRNEHTLLC